jgi:hypothetical protein
VAILGVSLLAVIAMRGDAVREIRQVVDASDAWVLGTRLMGEVLTAEVLDEGSDGGPVEGFPQYRWNVQKIPIEIDIPAEYFPGKDRSAIPQKPMQLLQVVLTIGLAEPAPDRPPELFRVVTYTRKRNPKVP